MPPLAVQEFLHSKCIDSRAGQGSLEAHVRAV